MKFDKLEELNIPSKNKLFIGYKGKSKFFIKEYTFRKGLEKEDLGKMRREVLCYRNVKSLNLPKLIKTNFKQRQVIYEFIENFKPMGKISKKMIDKIINLYITQIITANPGSLPKINYDYYGGSLYKRAKNVHRNGLLPSFTKIYEKFKQNKDLINKSTKYFSHGDLTTYNLLYMDKKLVPNDFEHSAIDNGMYDLSCLFVELYGRKRLRTHLYKKIKNLKFFNKKLFDLMVYRRCIEVMFWLQHKPKLQHFKNTKELIKSWDI
ncbi:hypothetical protein ACFLZZ_04400 [Nanoarchaeota archaeon]